MPSIPTTGAGPSAGGGWSPLDLPGLVAWYDASQITGLSDGDPVGTWSDLSGNSHDATQATAALKPLYKTNLQNGLAMVRGDGTDDVLLSDSLASNVGTIFAVLGNILYAGYNGFGEISDPGKRFMLMNNSTTVFYAGDANDLYTAPLVYYIDGALTSDLVNTGYHIVCLLGSSAVNCPGTLALMDSVMNGNIAGDAGEFILYDTVLSAADRAAVEAALSTK